MVGNLVQHKGYDTDGHDDEPSDHGLIFSASRENILGDRGAKRSIRGSKIPNGSANPVFVYQVIGRSSSFLVPLRGMDSCFIIGMDA